MLSGVTRRAKLSRERVVHRAPEHSSVPDGLSGQWHLAHLAVQHALRGFGRLHRSRLGYSLPSGRGETGRLWAYAPLRCSAPVRRLGPRRGPAVTRLQNNGALIAAVVGSSCLGRGPIFQVTMTSPPNSTAVSGVVTLAATAAP